MWCLPKTLWRLSQKVFMEAKKKVLFLGLGFGNPYVNTLKRYLYCLRLLGFLILLENLASNPNGLDHKVLRLRMSLSHVGNQSLEQFLMDAPSLGWFELSNIWIQSTNKLTCAIPSRFHIKIRQFWVKYWSQNTYQNTRTVRSSCSKLDILVGIKTTYTHLIWIIISKNFCS